MNRRIVIDCALIVLFVVFGLFPFDKTRLRAPWARSLFLLVATIGVSWELFHLAMHLRVFAPGIDSSRPILVVSSGIGGLLLGFVVALIISGQLLGKRQDAPKG